MLNSRRAFAVCRIEDDPQFGAGRGGEFFERSGRRAEAAAFEAGDRALAGVHPLGEFGLGEVGAASAAARRKALIGRRAASLRPAGY